MDTLDKKTRLELLRKATPEIQDMYGNEEVGKTLTLLATRLNITSDNSYEVLALSFGDIILGLYKKTSLPQILKDRLDLNDDQVVLAMEELQVLLNKIPEAESATDFVGTPKPISMTIPPSPQLADVKPMRTFPDDFNAGRAHSYGAFRPEEHDNDPDEPTHSTSQDDIIRK